MGAGKMGGYGMNAHGLGYGMKGGCKTLSCYNQVQVRYRRNYAGNASGNAAFGH